jgi:hypothetical protein
MIAVHHTLGTLFTPAPKLSNISHLGKIELSGSCFGKALRVKVRCTMKCCMIYSYPSNLIQDKKSSCPRKERVHIQGSSTFVQDPTSTGSLLVSERSSFPAVVLAKRLESRFDVQRNVVYSYPSNLIQDKNDWSPFVGLDTKFEVP